MKKTIILTTILSICLFSFGQKKSKTSDVDVAFEQAYTKYKNAIKYLDYNTAINAVQEILVLTPENINYKDTLLLLYSNNNQNTSAVLLAQEMEENGNSNLNVLEVLAVTYQQAGYQKEALEYYEKILKIEDKLFYNYQMATIQFNLSRLKECAATLNKIISNPESKKQTVQIDYDNNQAQKAPYAAAAYNILGVMSLQLKDNEQAKKYFSNALELYPDFVLAKNNLDYLNKK